MVSTEPGAAHFLVATTSASMQAQDVAVRNRESVEVALLAAANWSADTSLIGVSCETKGAAGPFDASTQARIVTRALGPRGFLFRADEPPCAGGDCARRANATRLVFAGLHVIDARTHEIRFVVLFPRGASRVGHPTITVLVELRGDAWTVQKVSAASP
jgi:hypothetical protein